MHMQNIVQIKLPKLGESVAEATILTWLKKPGDFIHKDEMIAEVATDKVDTDLPSEYAGTLQEIIVKEGETAAVGAVIATVAIEERQTTSLQPDLQVSKKSEAPQIPSESVQEPATIQHNGNGSSSRKQIKILQAETPSFLTPVVRNIAAEAGLTPDDLRKIKPTGSNQTRITKKDILAYLSPTTSPIPAMPTPTKQNLEVLLNDEVTPLSRMRKLIGQHMTQAIQTVPHVTTVVRADVTDLVQWRDAHKERIFEQEKVKITYTHLIMQRVTETLRQFPKLNAWMNGSDELIIKHEINLGFAAATPDDNLIVPNVKSAQDLSLYGLAKQVNRLGKAAKENKLAPSDIEKTTFTVSNTGIFGSLLGTPIISPPQVAVLALGEIESAPGVILENGEEKLAIRKQMYLSMSYDHRIIDGAYASRFLKELKSALQTRVL